MLQENILSHLEKHLSKGETINPQDLEIHRYTYNLRAKTIKSRVSYTSKIFEFSRRPLGNLPPAFFGDRWQNKKTEKQLKNWLNYRETSLAFEIDSRKWVEDGLLIRVTEFSNRGISSKGVFFIPGLLLLETWDKREISAGKANREGMQNYLAQLESLGNPYTHPGFETIRGFARKEVTENLNISKRAEFLLSLLTAAQAMPFFDWKEIGTFSATDNKQAASSKMYDSRRQQYHALLEELLQDTPESVGLTTVSGNYDLNFSARCRVEFTFGMWDYTECPVISRITDEEIAEITFLHPKEVHTLFLTENRAVLRKLAAHVRHEERRHVGMIAFDGQVRSSVYRFLKIWQGAGVKKLLVWSDFDEAAMYMLKKLHSLGFADFKAFVPEGESLMLMGYEQAVKVLERFAEERLLVEQESYLKDMEQLRDLIFNSNS